VGHPGLQPVAIDLQPISAKCYAITKDGRLSIGPDLAPVWMAGARRIEVYCIPMAWVIPLNVEAGHELEAWYLWDGREANDTWSILPGSLLQADTDIDPHLRSVIYPGSLQKIGRTCRLNCAGLLRSLSVQGHQFMWVAPEPTSISIWTRYAFNRHYGTIHER
jgi:hypothetical protein